MTSIQLAGILAAYAVAASRILRATKPLWDRVPRAVGVWLPPLLVLVTYLGERLSGVTTSVDLVEVIALAVAFALPGAASDKPVNPPSPGVLTVALLLLLGSLLPSCTAFKPTARTINDVAYDACTLFYGKKPGGIDVAKELCKRKDVWHAFLQEILAGQQRAGASISPEAAPQ